MVNCPICFEIKGVIHPNHNKNYSKQILLSANIIWEDDFIAILPSIGALNDSHVLVVPKRHVNSICELTEEELLSFVNATKMLDKLFLNKVIFFEHGSYFQNQDTTASSIIHAHLHALCLEDDSELKNWFTNSFNNVQNVQKINFCDFLNIRDKLKTNYIFYQGLDDKGLIAYSEKFESQIMRKQISKLTNVQWNWREHDNFDIVKSVIEKYRYLMKEVVDE